MKTAAMATSSPPAVNHTDNALRLAGVTLEYPDGVDDDGRIRTIRALDNMDFEAEPGTVTALIGPSGSGKSSLLAVAATLIRPTSGSVWLAGQEVTTLPEKELARLRRNEVGMVFQQPNLLPSLSAVEQLVLTAHLRGARGSGLRQARVRALELLDIVGLARAADRRPHQLSGGQRQRVNIARALMGRPLVMLVDEPTAALDQHRSHEIIALLTDATRRFSTATVIVTHDTALVPLTNRSVSMRDGRLI